LSSLPESKPNMSIWEELSLGIRVQLAVMV
jgi:hypothetical protein